MKISKCIISYLVIIVFVINCSNRKNKAIEGIRALINSERYKEAIEYADNKIKEDPDEPRLYYWKGWAYYCQELPDLAKVEFEKCIKVDPNCGDGYKGLANIYMKQKLFKLAEKNYLKAIELAKNNKRKAVYIGNLADMYLWDLKEYDKSIELTKQSIEIDDHGEAYYNLGLAYFHKGDKKRAEEIWLDGVNNKKFNEIRLKHSIYFQLSNLYFNKQDYSKSLQCIEKAIELSPNNAEYLDYYKLIQAKLII